MVKQFSEAFDETKAVLKQIDALASEAGDDFNEAQEEQAEKLVDLFTEKAKQAGDKAAEVFDALDDAREQRQKESDARQPIELPEPTDDQRKMQESADKVTDAVTSSINDHLNKVTHKGQGMRGGNPGVVTASTGNVADRFIHGDAVELATSEGALQVHETGDGSRMIYERGEAPKLLSADVDHEGLTNAETFAEGSSRNEGWDSGFSGEGDPYGILDMVEQSANPNAKRKRGATTKKVYGSITADAPADAAAHLSGQEEVVRDSTPEGDTTLK